MCVRDWAGAKSWATRRTHIARADELNGLGSQTALCAKANRSGRRGNESTRHFFCAWLQQTNNGYKRISYNHGARVLRTHYSLICSLLVRSIFIARLKYNVLLLKFYFNFYCNTLWYAFRARLGFFSLVCVTHASIKSLDSRTNCFSIEIWGH